MFTQLNGCIYRAARCHYAGTTTGPNKPKDGGWNSLNRPGVLRWRTPAGRTYTTTPTRYPG
jgi:hypothetical protein